jgi:hypothetical protein
LVGDIWVELTTGGFYGADEGFVVGDVREV